jgi:hypothetical protein
MVTVKASLLRIRLLLLGAALLGCCCCLFAQPATGGPDGGGGVARGFTCHPRERRARPSRAGLKCFPYDVADPVAGGNSGRLFGVTMALHDPCVVLLLSYSMSALIARTLLTIFSRA